MMKRKILFPMAVFIFFAAGVTAYGETKKDTYVNVRLGITIDCPKNWRITTRDNIIESGYGPEGILVRFRNKSGPYSLSLTVTLSSAMKMSRENWQAKEMVENYLQNFQPKHKDKFKLVESPQETVINDMQAAEAVYNIISSFGTEFREKVIYFRKNEFFIELVASAPREVFGVYEDDFDYAIKSLKLK
jgi:hypothetical protein